MRPPNLHDVTYACAAVVCAVVVTGLVAAFEALGLFMVPITKSGFAHDSMFQASIFAGALGAALLFRPLFADKRSRVLAMGALATFVAAIFSGLFLAVGVLWAAPRMDAGGGSNSPGMFLLWWPMMAVLFVVVHAWLLLVGAGCALVLSVFASRASTASQVIGNSKSFP